MRKQRILTICQGGNVRSVALGYLLKERYGFDAIACGWMWNTHETIGMLCEWADAVIILQDEFKQHVPKKYHAKLSLLDVGPDRWFNSLHPELLGILDDMIQRAFGKKDAA